jgi:hypothetical protein
LPEKILFSGSWPSRIGVAVHLEVLEFLSTLAMGEPMVFEIHGQMQILLQTGEELESRSLTAALSSPASLSANDKSKSADKAKATNGTHRPAMKLKRPRQRGVFWSVPPAKSPPAIDFPILSKTLEKQRKELPAGKAREQFLSVLKEADKVSFGSSVKGECHNSFGRLITYKRCFWTGISSCIGDGRYWLWVRNGVQCNAIVASGNVGGRMDRNVMLLLLYNTMAVANTVSTHNRQEEQ